MKTYTEKLITVLLIAALLLPLSALIGCAPKNGGETNEVLKDPAGIFGFLSKNAELPALADADDDTVSDIYGIDTSKLESYIMRESEDGLIEIGIFKVSDSSYLNSLSRMLTSRLASLSRSAENYSPEQYEILENTKVYTAGDIVFYLLMPDNEQIAAKIVERISAD
ncbi:MAG: DUF4358 domain-containing protein [Clostridia bacterium]|nr:DUF4358 domain-containing protein [Clostridia bacterium]